MRWAPLIASAIALVAAVGCHGKPHVTGTWVGSLDETASLEVIVDQHQGGGRLRKIHSDDTTPGATVIVGALDKAHHRHVRVPGCDVQARPAGIGRFQVAPGQHCHVALGSFDRDMRIAGTGTVDDGKLTLELTGTAPGVGGSYKWHFEGHRLGPKGKH